MSVEIAWKQNILVTDFQLLKSLLVVLGFGSQAFICGFSRQNICSVFYPSRGRGGADYDHSILMSLPSFESRRRACQSPCACIPYYLRNLKISVNQFLEGFGIKLEMVKILLIHT